MIVEVLRFYKKPMRRNDICRESQIAKNVVTFRIWENCEGLKGFKYRKEKDPQVKPLFYIDPVNKGPRGMELVGLIENE